MGTSFQIFLCGIFSFNFTPNFRIHLGGNGKRRNKRAHCMLCSVFMVAFRVCRMFGFW